VCSGILSFFGLTCHTRNGLSAEDKTIEYNFTSKALPDGKCSALNTCIYLIVVFFYSTGQSSLLDAVVYSIGLRSLYVNQGLKKTTEVFSIRTTVKKIKINDISA